jgi:hypothetical protein
MRTYLFILLTAATTTVLCAIAVSIVVDPYSIVHPLIGEYSFKPNSRVPKITFLSHSCSRYDAYFLGDSRSQILSESDLGNVRGRRFYNLATTADDMAAIVSRLNFLIERGCPISAVVVGESVDIVLDETARRSGSLLLSENPAVSGENRMAFYSKYFLGTQALVTYIRFVYQHPSRHEIYYPDGHADYLWAMENGMPFALAPCRGPTTLGVAERDLLSAKLPGYRSIAGMADRYHFKVIVWIVPLNKWESDLFDDPAVKDYLQQLRAIPNLAIVEADRNSPLLSDFRYWHDCRHFRRTVFDQLVAPGASRFLGHAADRAMPGISENGLLRK